MCSLPYRFTFLGTLPAVLIYWFACFILIKIPVKPASLSEDDESNQPINPTTSSKFESQINFI